MTGVAVISNRGFSGGLKVQLGIAATFVTLEKPCQSGLPKGRDALFELMDAMIERGHADCAAEISLSPFFRRQWSSLYKAVEEGEVDTKFLCRLFVRQVAQTGVQVYPLDSTMWAHPASPYLRGYGLWSQPHQSPEATLDCPGT